MTSLRVHLLRSTSGFTLVELLVVLVLMAILGAIIGTSVMRGLRADGQARTRIEAFQDMQVAMERMSRDIRAADPVMSADDEHIQVQVRRENECHRFTYRYDPANQEVRVTEDRFDSECDTLTGSFGPLVLLRDIDLAANDDVDAVFTYWDAKRDSPLDVNVNFAPAIPVYVEISFVHELALDQRPVTVSTLVGLRNR